jgi:hypothetical protein
MGQTDRGRVKTSARFRTDLFRSLLRGLSSFRFKKAAKNFALLDHLQIFAEFLHDLDPERQFAVAVVRPQGAQKLPLRATLPLSRPQLSTP